MIRASAAVLCAVLTALPGDAPRAMVSGAALADLVQKKKLGLSPEEARQALEKLAPGAAPESLNRSLSAQAVHGMARAGVGVGDSPFDGDEALDPAKFEEIPVEGVEGVLIDQETGQAKDLPPKFLEAIAAVASQEEPGMNFTGVTGRCPAPPTQAIMDLQDLVRLRVEDGQAPARYRDFFLYLYTLFFYGPQADDMPAITSGRTEFDDAIATFEGKGAGIMVFDCEKYEGLNRTLQRKIACHEFYHKFHFGGGEPPAYDVMSHC